MTAVAAQVILTLALAWLAFNYAGQDRSPTPCGTPLPEIPQIVTDIGEDFERISVAKGLIPTSYLQFMAPQPDGTMPLRYPLDVFRCDMRMMLPMGTTSLPMGDSFELDDIDSQVVFNYEQQLDYIKISMPKRNPDESVLEFSKRAHRDYLELGANFRPDRETLKLDGMIFQGFEYDRPTKYSMDGVEMDVSHYIYMAPVGERVLVLDFLTTPERHESARPLVEKMMRSINPGRRFLENMKREYPEQLGAPQG